MQSKSNEMPDFSSIKYERPDLDAFRDSVRKVRLKLMTAKDVNTASSALFDYERNLVLINTMFALCNIMHDLDTSNDFYTNELAFCDEIEASVNDLAAGVFSVMLNCPCAKELRVKYGDMILTEKQERWMCMSVRFVRNWEKQAT